MSESNLEKTKMSKVRYSQLPEGLDTRLAAYCTSAAAGLCLMSGTSEIANASVVYTPANTAITNGFGLDVNNDGVVDFTFTRRHSCTASTIIHICQSFLYISNSVNGNWAEAALPAGVLLGNNPLQMKNGYAPLAGWAQVNYIFSTKTSFFTEFAWANVTDRYLGLQFIVNEQVYYGWARISVNVQPDTISATLTGYAYETNPNTPIFTGREFGSEDSQHSAPVGQYTRNTTGLSLGRLALGSVSPQRNAIGTVSAK
jgi:hypothetical protein